MTFNRERVISILATGVGFLLTALAGLFLTGQAAGGDTGGLIVGALLAFVLVMPFFIFGIYMYIRSVRREEAIPVSTDMSGQRRLFDVIREQGCITVDDLAQIMDTPRNDIRSELDEMLLLRIFTAYYVPDTETICAEDKANLLALSSCRICQTAVQPLEQQLVTCIKCGTQYVVS